MDEKNVQNQVLMACSSGDPAHTGDGHLAFAAAVAGSRLLHRGDFVDFPGMGGII